MIWLFIILGGMGLGTMILLANHFIDIMSEKDE